MYIAKKKKHVLGSEQGTAILSFSYHKHVGFMYMKLSEGLYGSVYVKFSVFLSNLKSWVQAGNFSLKVLCI